MSKCTIKHLVLGMISTNCYLIRNDDNAQIIVVDPADQKDIILKTAKEMDGVISAILLTHGHFDHIKDAQILKEETGAPIYAMEAEKDVLEDPKLNLSGQFGKAFTVHADHFLKDGQSLEICGNDIRVIHTPGHTKGSGCYFFPEIGTLISGDTLFAQGYGRYDLPTGDGKTLFISIREKLLCLPEETVVLPGHGSRTSIGYEKRHNGVV